MKYPKAASNPNVTPSGGKGGSAGTDRAKADKGRGIVPGTGQGGSAGTMPGPGAMGGSAGKSLSMADQKKHGC